MEPQHAANRSSALIAILAASAFAFFFGLGRLGFLGPDEPRYAEVAREMFVSGDYISTRLCGCLWFEKPALLYWLSAIGYRFFGVNELAARLPSAVAALMTVLVLYGTLHRFRFGRLAASASLVLATSGIFIAYAHVAVPDMILTAATTAALLAAYAASTATGRARPAYWAASFGFMGLGVLAKGLVGIVLVLAIIAAYFLLTKQLKQVRSRDLVLGLAVFLVVAASWYAPVTMKHGWSFIEEFFIRHHFQRYTSNEFGHPQPIYFFPLVALAGAAPWTFLLVPAIARVRSLRLRDNARDSLLALAWIWVAVPLIFFSFSESKLPGYIVPISPALAVIIGVEIESFWRGDRRRTLNAALWLTALTVIGMSVALVVYSRREAPDISGYPVTLEYLPLAIAVGSIVALAANRRRAFVAGAAGVVTAIILSSVILLFPPLSDEVSMKSLSLEAAAALRPGEKIGFYLKKEFAPVFYAEGRVLCEPRRGGTFYALHEQMLYEALETEKSMIVITKPNWVEGLKSDPRFSTELIAAQGDSLAFRVALK
ncbi:MAG TPA: glycosyltransferase family 39 protein [Blastocatellia bacterium]|nr:glycosyltransferase family 39 protein [Blastocatellia bacterium]